MKDKCVIVEELPETIIERVFYEATDKRTDGATLRKEWIIDKDNYSKKAATIILDFEHFSLHDKTHSNKILNAIGLLLGEEKLELLSVGDLWLLLEVAYSHDIGMALTYDELNSLWTKDEEFKKYFEEALNSGISDTQKVAKYIYQADCLVRGKKLFEADDELSSTETIEFDRGWTVKLTKYTRQIVADYIRRKHAKRSQQKIKESVSEERVIEPRLYQIVADIAYLHTAEFEEIFTLLKQEEVCFGDSHMHPQFVAVLLRIGDLLDMDNNRFDESVMKHFGKLPPISELHLKKHKALKHFNVCSRQITAVAKSDEVEVCIEIAKWFQMLQQENEYLIAYWNQIAPEKLGGCTLIICSLKIYLKGEDFELSPMNNYEIDKQKALRLLVGNNIYENKLDFLREYVQNAIDACKMEFWEEWRQDRLTYLLQTDEDKVELPMPFDFKEAAFSRFSVRIKLEIVEHDILEISIEDEGVGIEKNGLSALTTLGSGWNKRECYQRQLKDVVFWLDPTAGFGVGVQAAFMISDEVRFYTKARMENKGHMVSLTSPYRDGKVFIQGASGVQDGTTVKLQIPLQRFLESDIYKQRYPKRVEKYMENYVFSGEDYFTTDAILDSIVNEITCFLKNQILNSVFPILIENSIGTKKQIYSSYWYKKQTVGGNISYQVREYQEYVMNRRKYYYSIEDDFSGIYMVDCEKKALTHVEFAEEYKGFFRYSFKGVGMVDEYEERFFFHGCVDILEKNVKKYLKVNRREFIKEIDKQQIFRENVEMALRIYLKILSEATRREKEKVLSSFKKNQFSNMLASLISFLPLTETRDFFTEIKDREDVDMVGVKRISWNVNRFTVGKVESAGRFFELIFKMLLENEILFVETEASEVFHIDKEEEILEREYQGTLYGEDLLLIRRKLNESCTFIPATQKTQIEMLTEMFGREAYTVGCGSVHLKVYGLTPKVPDIIKGEIDFEGIAKAGKRQIIQNASGYEKLHVKQIPFTKREDDIEVDDSYLIMPMNLLLIDKIDKAVNKKMKFCEFWEVFEKPDGVEKIELARLVNWVYQHQYQDGKYSRGEIREEYKQLLFDYYNSRREK